ncbi:toll-like receptor 4 [Branchiostoma floridae x Branchiostoma japonicum]
MNGVVNATDGYCFGNEIQVSCNPGYELVGRSSATCEDDGSWGRELPTCQRICCDHTISILNGKITVTDGYCSGNDIQFSCDPGYELVGRSSVTCLNDGSWDGEIPTCQLPSEQSLTSIGAIIGGAIGAVIVIVTACKVGNFIFKRWRGKKIEKGVKEELEHLMGNAGSTYDGRHKYDVFISYSSKEESWVRGSLLADLESNDYIACLDKRDFPAGNQVLANIVSGIYQSRKIILVMSKNFIKSHWCIYEMTLTYHRKLDRGENCVIVVKYDDCKMPRSLALRTYLDWTDQTSKETFWAQLHEALGPACASVAGCFASVSHANRNHHGHLETSC